MRTSFRQMLSDGGGSDPNLVRVSGTVMVDGKPHPLGMIVFEPDTAKGNRDPQARADIKDGRFDTRQSGEGGARSAGGADHRRRR